MRFNVLRLRNFMSQKELTVVFNGENKIIYGANESGKTTIFNSITWLFFNKNSLDLQFNPKPRGSTMLETEVELETDCGKFKRIQVEKWTKSRGKAQKELTGHTSRYYFNDVPKKEKYFKVEVENRINEKLFKLLTNPLEFTRMHWEKQREELFEISGKIEMDKIKKMQDEITVLKEERAKINKELNSIPIRIDETILTKPTPDFSMKDLEKTLKEINKKIKDLEKMKNSSQENKKASLEIELEKLKLKDKSDKEKDKRDIEEFERLIKENNFELKNEVWGKISDLKIKISELNNNLSSTRTRINVITLQIKGKNEVVNTYEGQLIKLRDEYRENNAEIDPDSFSFCPTCNQELPTEQIHKVVAEQKDKQEKEKTIINSKGLSIKADQKAVQKTIVELKTEAKDLKNKDYLLSQELQSLKIELDKQEQNEKKLIHPDNEELQNKIIEIKNKKYDTTEIEQLEIDIQTITHDEEILNKEYYTALKELEGEKAEVSKKMAVFDQIAECNNRIKELESEQKRNALLFEESEKKLFESEAQLREITTKVKEEVNRLFVSTKFELFEVQMNGGTKDICEATYKGIPFSDLNNAAKINVGLDIIDTLCRYYKTNAPIFIDNAESVNEVYQTDSQQILLKVVDPVPGAYFDDKDRGRWRVKTDTENRDCTGFETKILEKKLVIK